jgi:ppGpp synthetase/RelA/SpoT-type nucleotidyltranferase
VTLSKSQIENLGTRLRKAEEPSIADVRALNEFVLEQDAIRIEVEAEVRARCDPGEAVTSRLKTKTSILEKLRRQRTRLSEMQDIVGIRIVTLGNRSTQDELVRRIIARWPVHRLYDRRATPQFGYRAVHVVVHVRDRPAEIQVRTVRQHEWAELFEKVADKWGRDMRYGGSPDSHFDPKGDTLRLLRALSENINFFEAVEQKFGPQAIGDSFSKLEMTLDKLRKQLIEEER